MDISESPPYKSQSYVQQRRDVSPATAIFKAGYDNQELYRQNLLRNKELRSLIIDQELELEENDQIKEIPQSFEPDEIEKQIEMLKQKIQETQKQNLELLATQKELNKQLNSSVQHSGRDKFSDVIDNIQD